MADGRKAESLRAFYQQFSPEELGAIDSIAINMAQPFIQATHACVPQAEEKIVFDK